MDPSFDVPHVSLVREGKVTLSDGHAVAVDRPDGELVQVLVTTAPASEQDAIAAAHRVLADEHDDRWWGWKAHSRCLQDRMGLDAGRAETLLTGLHEHGLIAGPVMQANSCGSSWPGYQVTPIAR